MVFPKFGLSFLILFAISSCVFSQQTDNKDIRYSADVRILHFGSDTHSSGLHGTNSVRLRVGSIIPLNTVNQFNLRLAGSVSENTEPLRFTILNDGRNLDFGSISFDTFNYQLSLRNTTLKIGRFQHSAELKSVSLRSNFRLQSPINLIHWTDGLYLKHELKNDWFTEAILEYQNRGNLSYGYKGGLTFGKQEHNVAGFFNLENLKRDKFNFVQKGLSIFYAPAALSIDNSFRDYVAVMGRLAYDLPRPGILRGGSVRMSAEFGQNVNVALTEGTNGSFSVGILEFAGKHSLITEVARTDAYWLTPIVFDPSSDEIEFRYSMKVSDNLKLCVRYRIRDYRETGIPNIYSTFMRATIKI